MLIWMRKDMFDVIPKRCNELLGSAYNYLLSYKYFNFKVALAIKDKIPTRSRKGKIIVLGGKSCWASGCKETNVIWV